MKSKKQINPLLTLDSVGPATVQDLSLLGITKISQLVGKDPHELYTRLCGLTDSAIDICVQDIFAATIAQAEQPNLPHPLRTWFYYSRRRKAGLPYYTDA